MCSLLYFYTIGTSKTICIRKLFNVTTKFFGSFILLCLNLIAFSSVGYLGFVHPIGIELVPVGAFLLVGTNLPAHFAFENCMGGNSNG